MTEMRLKCLNIVSETTPTGERYVRVDFGYDRPVSTAQVIGKAKTPLGDFNIENPMGNNPTRLKMMLWLTEDDWNEMPEKYNVRQEYAFIQDGLKLGLM